MARHAAPAAAGRGCGSVQQAATTDAQERAAAAWRALGARVRTVTPAGLARIAIVAVTLVAILSVLGLTWPAIVPFLAGGVLAYAVLPIVDRLDRFMPRPVAGLLSVALVLAAAVGFIVVVGPPVVGQLVRVFLDLPNGDRLAQAGQRVHDWLATLPEGSQALATDVVDRVVAILRADLSATLDGLATLIANSIVHAFDALSVLFGLFVIPTWILAVTRDTPATRQRLTRHIAPWIRPDVLARGRIVDAVASAYLRVQLLASLGTGFGVWLSLYAVGRAGLIPSAPYFAVAAIAGAAQLIPQIGSLLGALPALVLLATQPPEVAVAFLLAYVIVLRLVGMVVGGRLSGAALRVHPAILIPGIVVASQIGIIPLLIAGPLIAVAVHSIRYLYGRFTEPPRPAGLLPWEPLPPVVVAPAPGRRVPLVYRRAAAARAASAAPRTATPTLPEELTANG
jgi:predicted PurR-regulated permease PerM